MPLASGAFPDFRLPDLAGEAHALSDAWQAGDALILIGHKNCKTTRQTLPYVDRIQQRRGSGASVLAVLQDGAEEARQVVQNLGLTLPIRLESDPYPLGHALDLATVPTLFLVQKGGAIERISEAFNRADLEAFAERLGVAGPLFVPADRAPAMKPG
jgi:peroxiredoxin